jgi:hypothetical protein
MVTQVGYSVARRSGGRVMPCVVCTMHMQMRSTGFLIEPQNQARWFVSGLASKPLGRFPPILPQNWWRWFSPIWPQNRWRQFLPVWPQNRWLRFPDLSLKTNSYGLVIWASKLSWRFLSLDLKTKQAMIYRLRHKTDGRATVWDTCRDLAACFT